MTMPRVAVAGLLCAVVLALPLRRVGSRPHRRLHARRQNPHQDGALHPDRGIALLVTASLFVAINVIMISDAVISK
jgi:hypothetical protein